MIPSDIEKLKTSQYLRFIDVTPTATNPTWKVLGVGITELATSYNPQVETEQWIIEDTARNDHTGNQKQSSVTQKCYKNDPTFEFINEGRDKLNYVTRVLEIDTWNGEGGSYPSKMSSSLVAVTSYSGAEIEYDLYFNGDPTDGTSTITGGTPTFTPSVSL
jgi:hypothetical protein